MAETAYEIPRGFEAAHEEWLKLGGPNIVHKYRHGAQEAFYRTTYWKLVRDAVLHRDNSRCSRCGKEALQVHHANYLYRGKDHLHPEHLVSVCRNCHGLVEYARVAEKLASSFRYRLERVQEYLADDPRSDDETPLKSLSRLLEYRARFENLRNGYGKASLYENRKSKLADGSEHHQDAAARIASVENEAKSTLDSWTGSDKDKSRRILEMLLEDLNKCSGFVAEVLGPISSPAKPPR